MPQSVIVLGAGMVGVSVALHLRRRGLDVLLVDRQQPGEGASFGNGGLIQREAVHPHPFPRDACRDPAHRAQQVDRRALPLGRAAGVGHAAAALLVEFRTAPLCPHRRGLCQADRDLPRRALRLGARHRCDAAAAPDRLDTHVFGRDQLRRGAGAGRAGQARARRELHRHGQPGAGGGRAVIC